MLAISVIIMSLDHPFYEEMVRRKSRAAWWWRIGDTLYYVGLLEAVTSIPAGMAHVLLSRSEATMLWYVLAFILGLVGFFTGSKLKAYSYKLAEQDGIYPA